MQLKNKLKNAIIIIITCGSLCRRSLSVRYRAIKMTAIIVITREPVWPSGKG